MISRFVCSAALLLLAWTAPVPAQEGPGASNATQTLGDIALDRATRTFSVPGRFLQQDDNVGHQLLEYLAVKRDGYKAYEAVLELDTTATEFNLACILIGLDSANATLPEYHFDPKPVEGDRVELWVEWEVSGIVQRVRPAELILMDGEPVSDHHWVYTGSEMVAPDTYLAEQSGTLVGFVHDRDSIIEHRNGISLGAPNVPQLNRGLMPPPDAPIRLIVHNPAPAPSRPPPSKGMASGASAAQSGNERMGMPHDP
jgi:hypothetical protein